MRSTNIKLAAPLDLSADAVSPPVLVELGDLTCVQAVVTGAPVGTMKIQVSCDDGTNQLGAGVHNWNDYTNSSFSISGAGVETWNINWAGFKWLRIVYTSASGSGQAVVNVQVKGPAQ